MDHPELKDFYFSDTHGFLIEDPEVSLSAYYSPWEQIGLNIPELLAKHCLRDAVHKIPLLETDQLRGYRQYRRAHLLLGFVCGGYVWQEGDSGVPKCLPRQVAVPYCAISTHLGLKPIISHPDLVLANVKLIDPEGPFIAENLTTICHFPGGRQYEWFAVVTAEIEKNAVSGIKASMAAVRAVQEENEERLISSLQEITDCLSLLRATLKKMYGGLESNVFFDVFRPFLSGWGGTDNPLPKGLIYEGVSDVPVKVNGGSAAQSSILGCFDAVLGIQHDSVRKTFLDTMLEYMPPAHKELILFLRRSTEVKSFVSDSSRTMSTELLSNYNGCVRMLSAFRSDHIQVVTKYIIIPSRRKDRNKQFEGVAQKGTGGTALLPFLRSLRDTTVGTKTPK